VELPAPMPSNIPEVKVSLANEIFMNNYYRFAQAFLPMPPMEGFDVDFDLGVEQIDIDPPDRARVPFFCARIMHFGTVS